MKTIRLRLIPIAALALVASALARAETTASFPASMENRLEEGILLQEGKGDLTAAAAVFKEVVAASGVAGDIGAEAQFRLAECYWQQGNTTLAIHAFKELLEHFPEQTKWTDAAKERLPKEFHPMAAPWIDGERLLYRWSLPSGQTVGYSVSTFTKLESEGSTVWRHRQRYLMNGHAVSVIEFDAETFRSLRGSLKSSGMGLVESEYGADGRSATVRYANNDSTQRFEFDTTVIDNEQGYGLMRQLPHEIGFQTEQTVFVHVSGIHLPVRFVVAERVPVETAAGSFDCYRIDVVVPGPKQSVFVSGGERRYIAKLEVGGTRSELIKIDTLRPAEEAVYVNEKYGFKVRHPDSWVVVEDPQPRGDTAGQQYFLDPEAKGGFLLYSDTNDKFAAEDRANLPALVATTQKDLMDNPDDTLDESCLRDWEVNGHPAQSFCVRGKFPDGKAKAVHVTVVMGANRHFVFQGHMPAEELAEMKPQLEALAAGLVE